MRAVKSKDTTPEMVVRRLVHGLGHRYRLHARYLPGKPDLVFAGRRKVVLVHGCFWHGHDCKRGARLPTENSDYWERKIDRNIKRDARNQELLEGAGWEILTIWECETKFVDRATLEQRLNSFLSEK